MKTPTKFRLTSHIETRLAILRASLCGASDPAEREILIRDIADLQHELESRQRAEKDPLYGLTVKCPASGTKTSDGATSCYILCPNCCRRTKVTARGVIRPHNRSSSDDHQAPGTRDQDR